MPIDAEFLKWMDYQPKISVPELDALGTAFLKLILNCPDPNMRTSSVPLKEPHAVSVSVSKLDPDGSGIEILIYMKYGEWHFESQRLCP